MNPSNVPQLTRDTLLILPCSGAKQPGSVPGNGQVITSILDAARSAALTAARAALRQEAEVDERTLTPAYLRYSGKLYEHGSGSIELALTAGIPLLIVSGGYGVVLANEPIGTYEKTFVLSDWPAGLLESCVLYYARHVGARSVIAVMSKSSGYAKLIKRIDWRAAGITATLITPTCPPCSGAQGKVPRAQGQVVAALMATGLDQNWRSSDSLPLAIQNL